MVGKLRARALESASSLRCERSLEHPATNLREVGQRMGFQPHRVMAVDSPARR